MKELIFKVWIGLCSYIAYVRNRRHKPHSVKSKEWLIIVPGVLGDTLVFLDALREIERKFSMQNKITLVCRKNMKVFLEKYGDCKVEILGVEVPDKWPSYKNYRILLTQIGNRYFDKVIVVHHHGWGHMLSLCVRSSEKIFLYYNDWYAGRHPCVKYAIRHAYDSVFYCPDDLFLGEAYARLLRELGDKSYCSKIGEIKMEKFSDCRDYIILAPEANARERNLSVKQFMEIIDYILKYTNYRIYLTGRKGVARNSSLLKNLSEIERVTDFTGKTNLDEFVRMIGNAKLLIGTDSGHIHLAASLGVPSICLVGKWHLGQFLPYRYAIRGSADPICIYSRKEYSCQNCQAHYGKNAYGKHNRECLSRIRKGKNNLCLEDICLEDVYRAIDKML